MKIPIEDQFIHRALFHEKQTEFLWNKKQPPFQKRKKMQLDFKNEDEKENRNTKTSASSQLFKEIKPERSSWPFFLSFQEFITNWIQEIVIRPSKFSIILSATLYLAAVASTIQRREGDRWFRFLLHSKLPGYSTLYTETSWESFQESDFKKYLDNPLYIQNYKTRTDSTKFCASNKKEKSEQVFLKLKKKKNLLREKSDHMSFAQKDLHVHNQRPVALFGLEGRKLVDMYKEKLFVYPASPLHKHIRKDFVGIFTHRPTTFSTNTSRPTQSHVTYTSSSVHVPKNKLLQNARLPLFRFVPIRFHLRENDFFENILPASSRQDAHFILPWYQIHACNKTHRTLFAAPYNNNSLFLECKNRNDIGQDRNETNSKIYSHIQHKSQQHKRERSRLGLMQKKNLFSFPSVMRLNSFQIQPEIWGLEYLFLCQTSRQRLYAQADFIPFKLESVYSGYISQKESPNSLVKDNSINFSHKYIDLLPIGKKEKGENNTYFAKNDVFCGQNFSFFQKELRKLFYLYGVKPASHFSMFEEEGIANSYVQKQDQGIEQSNPRKKQNFKEKSSSHVHENTGTDIEENNEEDVSFETVFEKKEESKNAITAILHDNFSDNTSSYKKLIKLISQQLKKQDSLRDDMQKKGVKAESAFSQDTHIPDTVYFNSTILPSDPEYIQTRPQKHKFSTKKDADALSLFHENSCSQKDRLCEDQNSDNLKSEFPFSFLHVTSIDSSQNELSSAKFPALENKNSVTKSFEKNTILYTRAMSGYKFPDSTKLEMDSLYRNFVLPHLFVSCSFKFSPSYVLDQALLRPLYLQLPPLLPASFFQNLALFCDHDNPNLIHAKKSLKGAKKAEILGISAFAHAIPKNSQVQLAYKRLSLQEFKQVKDVFLQLGRDFQDYLARPKDSPPAIQISPSLDDDNLFKREDEQKEKRDDDCATTFERLQTVREREQKFELAKKLRSFAYKNQFAFARSSSQKDSRFTKNQVDVALHVSQPAFDSGFVGASALHAQNSCSPVLKESSLQTPQKATHASMNMLRADSADWTPTEKAWVFSRLGTENMRSDRRHNFFGRKHLLTKRLVAHEQKEIRDQVVKKSFCAPHHNFASRQAKAQNKDAILPAHFANKLPTTQPTRKSSVLADKYSQNSAPHESNRSTKKENKREKQEYNVAQGTSQSISYRRLQRKARKGSIQLLGSPEFSVHQAIGITDRTRKPHRALRGKVLKSAYSHLRWQKKRFRSSMLGTPCKRHLVMPQITQNDWKKILEWQLKNYFFLEEKRLQPLVKENPEKTFKIRQLDIYLPWITIRSASNAPFQWPYTRLDGSECTIPPPIREKCYDLPAYTSVLYWDSGKSVSISQPPVISFGKKETRFKILPEKEDLKESYTPQKYTGALEKHNGIRSRITYEPYLCERYNSHSYLLVYRLVLAFACKHLFQYIYRVSLKRFLLQIVNTDSGLMLTSPEFREWLFHAPSKSVYTPKKRFKDVTVREDNIPILSETVWYLRNFGRGKASSQGLLLIGPPTSEKTSLVQAIAGECGLPIVVQSMGALALTYDEPYEQLENAFTLARQNAPCVLFLDDLDAIGQSRADVIRNDTGAPDLLLALETYTREGKLSLANSRESFKTHLLPTDTNRERKQNWNSHANSLSAHHANRSQIESEKKAVYGDGVTNEQSFSTSQQNQEFQTRRINLLLRLLTEMDGIVPLHGVVVVATSEQPALLDPALLRAGRFERKVYLGLPDHQRRIQLFQTQTQKLGHMHAIPWDYLGLRTTHMSGLDIISAINHSAIRAICDNTIHTIETLEHGLNCVTGLSHQALSPSISHEQRNDPFSCSRLAFFQAGKAVVHYLLLDHPELGFCSSNHALFSRHNTPVFSGVERKTGLYIGKTFSRKSKVLASPFGSKTQSSLAFKRKKQHLFRKESQKGKAVAAPSIKKSCFARTRAEFESRLVGFYAGKAAELLHLSSNTVPDFYKTQAKESTIQFSKAENSQSNTIWSDWGENSFLRLTRKSDLPTAWLWQSNLGFSELFTASSVIHVMIDRWYFCSQKLLSYKTNRVMTSLYDNAIQDESIIPRAQNLSEQLEFELIPNHRGTFKTYTSSRDIQTSQDIMKAPWCQANICQALEMAQRPYGKWYRMYLPHIEEREQNEEWLPPDHVAHESVSLHNITKEQMRGREMSTAGFDLCATNRTHSRHNIFLNKTRRGPQSLSWLNKRQEDVLRGSRLGFVALCEISHKPTKQAPTYKNINDLYLLERDRHYQNLVMDSFYTAFRLCHENRELLDLFADHLVRFHILRSHEIEKICQLFSYTKEKQKLSSK